MVMHPGIKLRHIRAFLEIADEGSLSAAARARRLTQPALSRSLGELEAMLGQPLFLRQGRGLALTEAGRLFRRHAAAGVEALEAGAAALAPATAGGRIDVGVLPTVAARLFPRVALRFGALRAGIVLSVETGPNTYLLRRLRDGAIDLMVGRMPEAAEMAGLTFEHLYEEEILLCARAGHPLAGLPARDVLRRSPLILPPAGAIIRRPVADYLAAHGLGGAVPVFETVSLAVGRGLLLGSDAVWFISAGVIAEDLARGDLVAIPTGARFLSGSVGMTTRQAGADRPGLDLLIQLTRDLGRRLQGGERVLMPTVEDADASDR
ncbi:LysR substrate-binding domain-containing protein [Prosthecomicrobium hirschii]|nr:LysR substrate-binding domain-containing protein [Prosthecomicrobium hirschii]